MTIVNTLPFILMNGTTADATQVMADFNQIVNDTNNNAAHNGVNTDITALTALVTPITPAQGGSTSYYGAGSGTANAQLVVSTAPLNFTLSVNNHIIWTPAVGNTGATTLKVGATTATNVYTMSEAGPVPLIGGEVIAGQVVEAIYDGTQFVLLANPMQSFGTLKNIASAATTDLGTGLSHNLNITGTVTITSFGATASTAYPLYNLVFAASLTLTHNATSLILPGALPIVTATGDRALALYLGAGNWQVLSYDKRNGTPLIVGGATLRNYIAGLSLSPTGASFGISAGQATDSTNSVSMFLNSAFTKTTASWAAGTGNGALDTGAIAANTWYHMFLIYNSTTAANDILFSLSATAPTLPGTYSNFRRIGSLKTNGASQWLSLTQTNNTFIWNVYVPEYNVASSTVRATAPLAGVPTGVVCKALLRVSLAVVTGTTLSNVVALTEAAVVPGSGNALVGAVTGAVGEVQCAVLTDASAQVGVQSSASSTAFVVFGTYGWEDFRGQ